MAPKVNNKKGMASSTHRNKLLGTPNVVPHPFKDLILRPPYREIRYTVSGLNSRARFPREKQIDEEVIDYTPRYDPKGLDVTMTKEPAGIHGPMLSISERNVHIDNVLSNLLYANAAVEDE
ncbi:hypothetical protein HAX54_044295 [Datura stramonium]|uniref:Uncharacterized protein n=1 Tax=Datura stramonium TaxID=4076 RepID=A0ABS8W3Q1_DATST|nr:hypothetical protein [Datura stramonium]